MKRIWFLALVFFLYSCDSTDKKSDTPDLNKTQVQNFKVSEPSAPISEQKKPQFIEDLEGLKFFSKNQFKLWKSYKLSNSYYGPGNHKNYSYKSSSRLGIEAHIKNKNILESISLSNSNSDIGVEFVKLLFKDINSEELRNYLEINLNKSINQIYETTPFVFEKNKIYAGSVLYGNTLSVVPGPDFKRIPNEDELGKKESYELINKLVIKELLENLDKEVKSKKLNDKYPLLAIYKEPFNLIPETKIYLYYEGLDDGPIYDKPGAKRLGANELGRVKFLNGSVEAKTIAHKELEGNRNYFYVITDNIQGWMGRPYIMKNKEGDQFFMPNPITGEKARKVLKISTRQIKKIFKNEYTHLIPSYDSISWDYRIPEKYRREGYDMYTDALNEGYRQHQSLVNSYISGTW